eukprot:8756429-Pyramimonas_sp.AAC.1
MGAETAPRFPIKPTGQRSASTKGRRRGRNAGKENSRTKGVSHGPPGFHNMMMDPLGAVLKYNRAKLKHDAAVSAGASPDAYYADAPSDQSTSEVER